MRPQTLSIFVTAVCALRFHDTSLRVHSPIKQQRYIEKTPQNTNYLQPRDAGKAEFPITYPTPTSFDPHVEALLPVPQWLQDFTGLTEWPGMDPPYIPLEFIKLEDIPAIPPYEQGICPGTRDTCSFDCFKCVEADDVFSCPKLSQSFDDGPSPATSKLLAHLKNKSTFFTLGINVVQYPEIYQDVQRDGHLLGSHTWSHEFLPHLTNERLIAQFEWSIWAMNATGHHLPKWFRPPYGGLDNRVRHILRKFGMQAALWDHDTFDWKILSNQKTAEQVLNEVSGWINESEPPTGLILEHDGTMPTVNVAIDVNNLVGPEQWTVAQCVGGADYVKVFDE